MHTENRQSQSFEALHFININSDVIQTLLYLHIYILKMSNHKIKNIVQVYLSIPTCKSRSGALCRLQCPPYFYASSSNILLLILFMIPIFRKLSGSSDLSPNCLITRFTLPGQLIEALSVLKLF